MRLYVGLTTLIGSIERYSERFNVLELRADSERLPSPKALRRLHTTAPSVATSLLLPPRMTSSLLDAAELPTKFVQSADALGVNWVVIQTGPELGPSRNTRARLAALVERLRAPNRNIAWEPRGMWEEDLARAEAETLKVSFVQDLSVSVGYADDLVYTRLRALGPGAQLRASALSHLAEQLVGTEEATIVIEGRPSGRARGRIVAALEGTRSELDEDDDLDEGSDDDDDGDGDADEDDLDEGDDDLDEGESDDEDQDDEDGAESSR
jgi:hypothetical protein